MKLESKVNELLLSEEDAMRAGNPKVPLDHGVAFRSEDVETANSRHFPRSGSRAHSKSMDHSFVSTQLPCRSDGEVETTTPTAQPQPKLMRASSLLGIREM